MSYEVTKRIKGRDYRYRVESYRDPASGSQRTRWKYLGKLDGNGAVAPGRASAPRVSREDIIAVMARLLETRDASRITVSVIAHHAGISAGTFYRHFSDRSSALSLALASLAGDYVAALPSLAAPIQSLDEERARLNAWFGALHHAVLHGRAFRAFLTSPEDETLDNAIHFADPASDPQMVLAEYLRSLQEAHLAYFDDADALAESLMRLHFAVVRDMAMHNDRDDAAATRWALIFPVIERAVFARAAA